MGVIRSKKNEEKKVVHVCTTDIVTYRLIRPRGQFIGGEIALRHATRYNRSEGALQRILKNTKT